MRTLVLDTGHNVFDFSQPAEPILNEQCLTHTYKRGIFLIAKFGVMMRRGLYNIYCLISQWEFSLCRDIKKSFFLLFNISCGVNSLEVTNGEAHRFVWYASQAAADLATCGFNFGMNLHSYSLNSMRSI